MSLGPLVFSNSLLGITNHYLTYGLFFIAGWFDLLGGMLPAYQFIDLGVTASAWLGGAIGMMISGMSWSPDYLMAPAIPAVVAGVLTAVLCGMVEISYCRVIALALAVLFWSMQSNIPIGLNKA